MRRLFYVILITVCILFAGCSNDVIKDKDVMDTQMHYTQSKEGDNQEIKDQETDNKETEKKRTENKEVKATPILIGNYFIGGVIDGNWYSAEEFYNKKLVNMEEIEYNTYAKGRKIGTFKGSKPSSPISGDTLEEDLYISDYVFMKLYDENKQTVDFDIALKQDWDIFPRSYQRKDPEQGVYKELIEKILIDEGIENPVTHIKEIIRVDLDGDGTEEVIVTANDTADNKFDYLKKGDHAIVLFRKIVNGEVQNQIIHREIQVEEPEEFSIYRYLFEAYDIADLDGDGIMEVIIKGWYYEGEYYQVYKLINDELEAVAVNGFGV